MGFGVSVALAPDIRLHATSRGVRAGVGPRAAPTHSGTRDQRTPADRGPVLNDAPATGSAGTHFVSPFAPDRPALARLDAQERTAGRGKGASIRRVLQAERALTTRHLADFPISQPAFAPPAQPLDVDRIERSFRRQALADLGWFNRAQRQTARLEARMAAAAIADERHVTAVDEAERLRSAYHSRLDFLRVHDREAVVEAVDEAFAEHVPESTCVDAGTDDSGPYVSCVVTFGHPDLVPSRHVATGLSGRPALKRRSRSDINDLYVAALASLVLATARQALAVAPATDEVRIAVVRTVPATFFAANGTISLIYAGTFPRHDMETVDWQSVDWQSVDLESELRRARDGELVRTGAARTVVPLGEDAHRRMAAVLHAFPAPAVPAPAVPAPEVPAPEVPAPEVPAPHDAVPDDAAWAPVD